MNFSLKYLKNNYVFYTIIIIIIFYIFNLYLEYQEDYINENFVSNNIKDMDIIIARYNEDLKWTTEKPFNQFKYIVYNKGDNELFYKTNVKKIINLPNVGKCDHTYLYHIINNYDNLSDITVFFPGSVDLLNKKKIAKKLLKEITIQNQAIFISLNEYNIKKLHYNFKLDKYETRHESNKNKSISNILKKSIIRPFGLWFEDMFGNLKINCLIYYGIFSINKKDIIQHPVSRYERLIKDLSDDPNPEVGHYIERSWCAIFHPLNNTIVIKYNKL